MKKRATQKDIAKRLGTSESTVSRALKNHPSISMEMKIRVNKVAEDLNYQTNFQAIYFRQKSSKLIALILPKLGRFFTPDMVSAIEQITRKKGYNLILFQSDELLTKERECMELCKKFEIDGLLVSVTSQTNNISHFDFFLRNEIPFVLVDRVIEQKGIAAVKIDDYKTAYSATEYLIKKNHRKIAGVFNKDGLTITKKRKEGFEAALKYYNIPHYNNFCFSANSSEKAKNKFLSILAQDKKPDAVFVMSDDLLAGVNQAIHENKELRIGKDISVISISNGYLPKYIYPRITHIKHSGNKVGEVAANYLMKLIENPTISKKLIEVETEFVEFYS